MSLLDAVRKRLGPDYGIQSLKAAHDALDSAEWLLGEARSNIAELADDLKNFYIPEKGWPPHINEAHEMLAELDDALKEDS